MTYAGAAPTLVGCGDRQFDKESAYERCVELRHMLSDKNKYNILHTMKLMKLFNF